MGIAVSNLGVFSTSEARPVRPELLGLKASFINDPRHYAAGSQFKSKTGWCDFAIDVSPAIAAVSLVVRRFDENGKAQVAHIPMRELQGARAGWNPGHTNLQEPRRWAISVGGIQPGEQYAYRLLGADGQVIADHASDPFALASTHLKWREAYLTRVRATLDFIRQEGDTDGQLLKRLYATGGSAQSSPVSSIIPPASSEHFDSPWSIVVDRSKLLDPHKVAMPQPHGAGQRDIIKYHPLHSLQVSEAFISPEYRDKRGYIECLKDRRFTDYLARYGNTIEFFPLGHSVSDPTLVALGRSNVWGYMPTQACGLNPEYFTSNDPHDNIRTLQEVVYILKERGFSVICDVVSGHTAETGDVGPFFSLRQIYPEAYFLMDHHGRDIDVTGCGNTLNPFSPLAVELLRHQSDFFVKVLGVERRIDQAATLGIADISGEGFDPRHQTFDEIIKMSPAPIVELMHTRGHHNRAVPDDGVGNTERASRIASKDFWLRNLEYALSFGEATMWPDSNPKAYRAFIASGSCGGVHPLQQKMPWSQNYGVQVFAHDGETVFDRARWMAVRVLRDELSADPQFKDLIDRIDASSDNYDALHRERQERYRLMSRAVEYLQEHHPVQLEAAQGAAARWFLTQLYTTPGDVLIVAGDHIGRSQGGNSDGYDCRDSLVNALRPSSEKGMANNQIQSGFLTHRLRLMRDRFPEIFKNTAIVNGFNPSSYDPALVLSLSWYNQSGLPMAQEDWEDSANGDLFLGWTYTAHPVQDSEATEAHTKLFFADSSKEREFILPDPGQDRAWRVFVDSTRPLLVDNHGYQKGDTYRLPTCGSVVLESVRASYHRQSE